MKFATCNEPWKGIPVEEVFRRAREIGYEGVEIAPFTIAPDVREIPGARRFEIARAAADQGIQIVGNDYARGFAQKRAGILPDGIDAGLGQGDAERQVRAVKHGLNQHTTHTAVCTSNRNTHYFTFSSIPVSDFSNGWRSGTSSPAQRTRVSPSNQTVNWRNSVSP